MKTLFILAGVLYLLGMLRIIYQIRHAPTDLELWGEEIE